MKNNRKLFGFTALAAVILLGLAFTACEDTNTYMATFSNESSYDVKIVCSSNSADPRNFTLKALTNKAGSAETQDVTWVGGWGKLSFGWSLPGASGDRENFVKCTESGTGVIFTDKSGEEGGLFDVQLAE